jgi:hypothetical protein
MDIKEVSDWNWNIINKVCSVKSIAIGQIIKDMDSFCVLEDCMHDFRDVDESPRYFLDICTRNKLNPGILSIMEKYDSSQVNRERQVSFLVLAMVMKSTRDFSTCSARWSPVRVWGRSRYFREQYPKRVGKMWKTVDWEIFVSCAISRTKAIRSEMNTSQIRTSCCRFRGRSSESWDSLSGVF